MVILGLSLTAISLIITFLVVRHNNKQMVIIEQEEIERIRAQADAQNQFNNRYGRIEIGQDGQYFVPPGTDVRWLYNYSDPWTMTLPSANLQSSSRYKHGQPVLFGDDPLNTKVLYWDAVKHRLRFKHNLTKLPEGSNIPVYKRKKHGK